jgi:hypothetical protein
VFKHVPHRDEVKWEVTLLMSERADILTGIRGDTDRGKFSLAVLNLGGRGIETVEPRQAFPTREF